MLPNDQFHVTVFCANGVGDHVLALPTLNALANMFPDRLTLILLPRAYQEFFLGIKKSKLVNIRSPRQPFTNWWQGTRPGELQEFDYLSLKRKVGRTDVFISLCLWHSPHLQQLIDILTPAVTIGFHEGSFEHVGNLNLHAFDMYFSLLEVFKSELMLDHYAIPPKQPRRNRDLAAELRESLGSGTRILVVHTDTKRRKMWPPQKFLQAIDAFLASQPKYVAILIGLHHDLDLRNSTNNTRIIDFCGLPLGLTFSIIGVADLFLGIDSCMLHIADLYRVPGVALFGPTEIWKWGYRFTAHRHLVNEQIDSIDVQDVVTQLLEIESYAEQRHITEYGSK